MREIPHNQFFLCAAFQLIPSEADDVLCEADDVLCEADDVLCAADDVLCEVDDVTSFVSIQWDPGVSFKVSKAIPEL